MSAEHPSVNILMRLAPFFTAAFFLLVTQATAIQPNILFLLADDQDWTGLSTPMHPDIPNSKSDFYETPHLEKFASQGMRFSAAYAPAPVCSPTRISLQTGQNPAQLHWTKAAPPEPGHRLIEAESRKNIRPDEVTIAELLQNAGYATAHYGKWHLGGGGPEAHGYDESDGDTGNEDANRFMDPNPVDIFGMGQRATTFMASQEKTGKPFFIQISYHALHRPENALKATREYYENKPPGRMHRDAGRAAITTDLDTGVGRLLEDLERLGLADNTYVIYMSDNGAGGGGPRPLSSGKGGVWEGGIRVPLIIRGPGIKPNSWCHQRVVGYDFFPTFCHWAGIRKALPSDIQGGDISHLFNGSSTPVKRAHEDLIFHFPHYQGDTPHSAILSGNHKLIHFYETGDNLLFDLETDLAERNNLAASKPELAAQLAHRLHARLTEFGAAMPRPNKQYDSSKEPAMNRKGGKGDPDKKKGRGKRPMNQP